MPREIKAQQKRKSLLSGLGEATIDNIGMYGALNKVLDMKWV